MCSIEMQLGDDPAIGKLCSEKMELKDGYLTIPNRPGCGFTLNPEVLDKNRLS